MNYMALVKLLVLIDRKALLAFGRPLTGDKISAMKNGLVLSRVLDFVSQKKQEKPVSYWHKFISRPAPYVYTVRFSGPADTSALSEAELALIDEVYSEHRNKSEWDLSEIHHQLPEWKEANPGKSSVDIPFERILELESRSADQIHSIADESLADRAMGAILEKARK